MRFKEFLSDDLKHKVIRKLQKKRVDDPAFPEVYKLLTKDTTSSSVRTAITKRAELGAPYASKYMAQLLEIIPTLGSQMDVDNFLKKFSNPNEELIKLDKLFSREMSGWQSIDSIFDNTISKELFLKLFPLTAGKKDSGAGELALAIMSKDITTIGKGDINVDGFGDVEVKSGNPGKAGGRIGDWEVDQSGMHKVLENVMKFNVRDDPVQAKKLPPEVQNLKPTNTTPTPPIVDKNGQQDFDFNPINEDVSELIQELKAGISIEFMSSTLPKDFPTDAFIHAATSAFFGAQDTDVNTIASDLIKVAGTRNFRTVWKKYVFLEYKQRAGFEGILAISTKAP